MKGLIIKEFLCLKNNKNSLILLLIIFLFSAFFTNYSEFVIFMLPSYSIMLILSNFSYDEYNRFDEYCLTMPFRRREIVRAKYIFSVFMLIISMLICIVIAVIVPLWDSNLKTENTVTSVFAAIFASSLVISITLPFIYKYGAQKGRIMLLVVFGGIGLFGGITLRCFENLESDIVTEINKLEDVVNFEFISGIALMLVLSAIIMFASYKISCFIYENKKNLN